MSRLKIIIIIIWHINQTHSTAKLLFAMTVALPICRFVRDNVSSHTRSNIPHYFYVLANIDNVYY